MQLTVMEAEGEKRPSLGRLLHLIEDQARKTCDADAGGCGAWNATTHILDRAPRVFTLQLAWESQREEGADIAATLAGVQEQVGEGAGAGAGRGRAGRLVYVGGMCCCSAGALSPASVALRS
jgi:hypothetical protein